MKRLTKDSRVIGFLLLFTFFSIKTNAQFIINGSASDLGGGEYMLTPAQGGKVGTIWSDQKVSLNNSFEVELEVYYGTSDGGADGITFSLQPRSNTVGVSGGGLGISGITPSLITEMDTYQNGEYGDPSYDHIALTKNTVDHKGTDNLVAPVHIVAGQNNVEDGAWYNFKATWDPATQVYQVSVNGAVRLFYQGDIINTIFNGDPDVFWGFTASTGGRNNLQKVRIINTTIIDIYTCTETPNDQTFCPPSGGTSTVNLSISNTQAGATYEWYDTPTKDNLLGTGSTFTTPGISDNTDYYVLATTAGGTTTATVGPTAPTTIDGIYDAPYLAGYDRNFTAHVPVNIVSVEIEHPAWQAGCGAVGTTKLADIDVYNSSNVIVATKTVNAACGEMAAVPLGFSLPAGTYTMKLRGIVGGTFRLNSDGSEKSIPGVITLENNTIANQWGTELSYSSVFFNWQIEGGAGTAECLLSVKAEKDCPPCATFPAATIGTDFTYCNDSDTTITVTSPGANVLWNNGETTRTITVEEGTFTVAAWDDENCKTYSAITVNKECLPQLILVDSVTICSGVTSQITAEGMQTGIWDGTDAFIQISDSVIEVNLQADAEYYVTNYTKLNILSDNINFEQPVINAGTFSIVNANTVPGWQTTASDNMVEIWSAGFQGVQPYSGNQFMELNANMDAALFQNVITTPGELMGVTLAHRGRAGVDVMELLAGPPGGPYTSVNTYSDGNTAWGNYTDYYRVPAGQTTTQFLFETVSCNGGGCTGSGNFLDAIEFFKIREEYDTVYVEVKQSPLVDLGNDTIICGMINETLDAGNLGASYVWSTAESTQTIDVSTPNTYSVAVEQSGCFGADTIVITQGVEVLLELGVDDSICAGDVKTLDTQNPGLTHLWNTGATTQTIDVLTTGEYSVRVSSVDGCVIYDTIQITVNGMPIADLGNDTTVCEETILTLDSQGGGYNVLWSTMDTSSTIEVVSSGNYGIRISSSTACYDEDTIEVTVQNKPVVDLGADGEICIGDTYRLDAGNAGLTFSWNTSESSQTIDVSTSGNFSVVVTDAEGCEGTDDFNLTVHALPIIDVSIPVDVCYDGGNVAIQTNPTGGVISGTGVVGGQWNPKDGALVVDQGSNVYYDYTDANNCSNRDSAMVILRMEPIVTPLFSDTSICTGDNVFLSASSDVAVAFEWLFSGSVISNSSTVSVENTGVYTVLANTAYCASKESEVSVTVLNPEVEISTPSLKVKEDAMFEISVINPNSNFSYSWDNQTTGATNTGENWVTSLSEDAVISVVAREQHCEASDQLEIMVLPYLEIPNVFTPNGDGEGDAWQIDGLDKYEFAYVKIYNRWGLQVYESIGGYEIPWDGTYNGNVVPDGTYFYVIELIDGSDDSFSGTVLVLR